MSLIKKLINQEYLELDNNPYIFGMLIISSFIGEHKSKI